MWTGVGGTRSANPLNLWQRFRATEAVWRFIVYIDNGETQDFFPEHRLVVQYMAAGSKRRTYEPMTRRGVDHRNASSPCHASADT